VRYLAVLLAVSLFADSAASQVFDRSGEEANTGSLREREIEEVGKPIQFVTRISTTPEDIRDAEIITENGRIVYDRILADSINNIILGSLRPDIKIDVTDVIREPGATKYIVSTRQNGRYVLTRKDDLYLVSRFFEGQCFNWETLDSSSVEVAVNLLLDTSYSMANVMGDVRKSTEGFLQQLPKNAVCQMQFFGSDSYFADARSTSTNSQPLPLEKCSAFGSQMLNKHAQAEGGGTQIAKALLKSYGEAVSRPESLNLTMLITDGGGEENASSATFQKMMALRQQAINSAGVYTFVNWLGNFDQSKPISAVADGQMIGVVANRPVAEDFFRNTVNLLENQMVLTTYDCP